MTTELEARDQWRDKTIRQLSADLALAHAERDEAQVKYNEQLAATRQLDDLRMGEIFELKHQLDEAREAAALDRGTRDAALEDRDQWRDKVRQVRQAIWAPAMEMEPGDAQRALADIEAIIGHRAAPKGDPCAT